MGDPVWLLHEMLEDEDLHAHCSVPTDLQRLSVASAQQLRSSLFTSPCPLAVAVVIDTPRGLVTVRGVFICGLSFVSSASPTSLSAGTCGLR